MARISHAATPTAGLPHASPPSTRPTEPAPRRRSTRPRTAVVLAVTLPLLVLASCFDLDDARVLGPDQTTAGGDDDGPAREGVLIPLDCAADVGSGALACASPDPETDLSGDDVAGLIVGGQGLYVTLTSSNVCYEDACSGGAAGDENFQADVTVRNLIPQALATTDGSTGHSDGVRVFFTDPPATTAGAGTVTIANADDTATFTAADQPFHQYGGIPPGGEGGRARGELGADGLLSENETSAARTWRWNVPATVDSFTFSVYVSAAVQHPDGWVEVDPPTGRFDAGQMETLTATVYDVVGREVTGRTLSWSSSDDEVATVADGTVTAVAPGLAAVTAASDGPESDGSTGVNVDVLLVDSAAAGTADGLAWADAYPNLQDALAAAATGDEVWVAEGTYHPDDGVAQTAGDRAATFTLLNAVEIHGGFLGGESRRDQRAGSRDATILSGDIGVAGDSLDNAYHVVTASGTDASAVLGGFTIRDGNADGAASDNFGGGILNVGGSPTLADLAIRDNAASDGGGVYNDSGSAPTLTDSDIVGNSATTGGGMYNSESSPVLTNVRIRQNSADAEGGGIANVFNSAPELVNVLIDLNVAIADGGGIYSVESVASLTNVTVTDNQAQNGGGIANYTSASPIVRNSILWGNIAFGTGFEVYNEDSFAKPSFANSIVGGSGGSGTGWDSNFGTDEGGNLDTDPLFVDPNGADDVAGTEDDDLRLQSGSPAIDAGDNADLPADDHDLDGDGDTVEPVSTDPNGDQRIVGGTVDMGAYENQDAAAPGIATSLASLNFGTQAVTTPSDPETVTVTNTGTADLTVTGMFIFGSDAAAFVIAAENCTAGPIAPGQSCEVDVVFDPSSTGVKTATLQVDSDAGSVTVDLEGTGV